MCMMASCDRPEKHIDGLPFRQEADGKWGIMSTDGEILVPDHTFEEKPSCVINGMFTLPDGDKGVRLYQIDNPYEPVVHRLFYRVGYFFEEVTLAQETPQSPILIIDKEGRNLFSSEQIQQFQIDLMYNLSEGRALFVTREGKYGYLDVKGNVIVPPLYDCAYPYSEGLALVGMADSKGRMGYQMIDRQGHVNFAVQLVNGLLDEQMGDGLLLYEELTNHHIAYLDDTGVSVLYLSDEIKGCTPFKDGLAVFQTDTGHGVIDRNGEKLISARYDKIAILGKNRVALWMSDKCRLADKKGRILSLMECDSIGQFYASGMAVVRKDTSYYWMDVDGSVSKEAWCCIAEDIEASRMRNQVFYRQKPLAEESVVTEVKEVRKKEEKVVRRTMDRNAWKKIGEQNPFYEEMKRVVSGELEETDAENRCLILNYVEHFRTSYSTKDIDFLEQLFSENALIVVGTVVNTMARSELDYLPKEQVLYNVKSKREYLARLREVFKSNKKIDVGFSGFKIMRHPTQKDIYGVSLRQQYSSDNYSDDGYLFLLWDFQDRMAPKIHVRTWQPFLLDDRTPLPVDKVFNIRNFNLK